MANVLYNPAKKKFLDADIDLLVDNIKAVLVDLADYTFNIADEFLSDIPVAGRVAISDNLDNKSTTNGVFDADNAVFALVSGDVSEAVVLFKDTGSPATSPLILYIDSATGLPITPNGANINLQWNDGANKIFALT